jgi:glutathione S-transferase
LQGKEYVVGSRTTLADIILFATYLNFCKFAADAEFVKNYPNVVSWYNKLASNDHFKKVIGEFKWPEKEFAPNSLKF